MGNSASGEDDGDYLDDQEDEYAKQFDGIETLGYRVLGVQPDSPASKAGLVSFFDFIVGANHKMLLGSGTELEEGEEYDDVDFPRLLRENLNKPVQLLVFNIKARDQRVVEFIPSDNWGGAGLLGVTIKLDDYGGADERLIRVLEVDEGDNGPAKLAGLIPQKDFLLGTTGTTLTNSDVLAGLLNQHLGGVVELYVYNSDTDLVRIVGLHPTYNWGYGESMLGAAVGTGYLHRLPESCRSTIGKSVERTVSVVGKSGSASEVDHSELNETNIRMEGTLEMEVECDNDVGLAARGMQVQPHRLGTSHQLSTKQEETANPKPDPPSCAERASAPDQAVQTDNPQKDNTQQEESTIEQTDQPQQAAIDTSQFPPPLEQPESLHEANKETTNPFQPPPSTQGTKSPVFPQPPPPEAQPSVADFPDAAPVVSEQKAVFPPPPPPTPVAETATATVLAFPPPPPPPMPEDPPAEDDDYMDGEEDGSEYTDEGDYTESEEPETPDPPQRGGFFGFMSPPPKMTY